MPHILSPSLFRSHRCASFKVHSRATVRDACALLRAKVSPVSDVFLRTTMFDVRPARSLPRPSPEDQPMRSSIFTPNLSWSTRAGEEGKKMRPGRKAHGKRDREEKTEGDHELQMDTSGKGLDEPASPCRAATTLLRLLSIPYILTPMHYYFLFFWRLLALLSSEQLMLTATWSSPFCICPGLLDSASLFAST